MEAAAAAKKADSSNASAEEAVSRDQAKRKVVELERRKETMGHVLQEQRERRAKMLVRHRGATVVTL